MQLYPDAKPYIHQNNIAGNKSIQINAVSHSWYITRHCDTPPIFLLLRLLTFCNLRVMSVWLFKVYETIYFIPGATIPIKIKYQKRIVFLFLVANYSKCQEQVPWQILWIGLQLFVLILMEAMLYACISPLSFQDPSVNCHIILYMANLGHIYV
jgi:hypothetical protein